jgi:hypothetical protein
MDLFADRYLHLPAKYWQERRQHLLWPVYVWRVNYPAEDLRLGANLFQEAILGLARAGVRDSTEVARLLALHPELVRFIIATQLQPNGWLDPTFRLTPSGAALLDEAEDSRLELKVGYAFQDAISGAWLPRFLDKLPEIAPVAVDAKGYPEFMLDRERGRTEKPFILPAEANPCADPVQLIEAYRLYRKDLSAARRGDGNVPDGVNFQVIESLGGEPSRMYLWCELYRDEGELQPWLVSDPFRLRRAASWLRKPLLDLAPGNQAVIRKMQQLVDMPVDACTAEEWLRQVEEGVELEMWGEYPFLSHQELIRGHLSALLRQKKKIESRERVNREDLSLLMGEAHNLLEAVLKWLLLSFPGGNYPQRNYWSRSEAKLEFNRFNLSFLTPRLIEALIGQSPKYIRKAVQFRDQPLKALLAGAVFCADEREDHPFRKLALTSLELERLPALADFRNEVSGHASGKPVSRDKVLESTHFAIQWMALFQPWY